MSQIKPLEAGGIDAVVIETMLDLEETKVAISAARTHTNLTVIATMTFDKGPKGFFTMMGITPETAANELRKAGADVVGSNCGNGIDNMIEIANKMRLLKLPPVIKDSLRSGNISYGHARSLISIRKSKDMIMIYHRIINKHLSVRDTELLVGQSIKKSGSIRPNKKYDFSKFMNQLSKIFNTKMIIYNI